MNNQPGCARVCVYIRGERILFFHEKNIIPVDAGFQFGRS